MFEIGDRVICVNATMKPNTIEELKIDMPNWVKQDAKYTIRGFTDNNGIVDGVWLEEIRNDARYFKLIERIQEPAFALFRFAKIEPAEIFADELSLEEVA